LLDDRADRWLRLVILTIAAEWLAVAHWAALDVAPKRMKLAFSRRTVMARAFLGTPVLPLCAICDSFVIMPLNSIVRLKLRLLEV